MFLQTIKRELLLAFRNPSDFLNPLVFFVIVVSLFPLGISPSPEMLVGIAPGVFWVAALLSTILSLDHLFKSDFDDGSLEQMLLGQQSFYSIVVGKIVSHWLISALPLLLISPLLGLMLFLPWQGIEALVISLLVGTPILSLVGSIGSSLVVGLKKSGILIAILILPIYIPVLILTTALVATGIQGGSYIGHLYWLGALLALGIALAPLATMAGIRISVSH